jgi:DNA polymerase-1
VPVKFHEEDFKIKDWNKDALKEVFSELEFRTIAQRILGEVIPIASSKKNVVEKEQPQGVQTDLFGNTIEPTTAPVAEATEGEETISAATKNINNSPHVYTAAVTEAEIKKLVAELSKQKEICFDTETTGLDANQAELVGMSFSWKPGEAWYVPCPADQKETNKILKHFESLFNDEKKIWVGQNLKYDMLMLKWYGVELKGNIFDTMLAHYVIEPDGKRSMDILSAQFLGYEPVHIDELIGKKGKTQGTMRDVELEKIKDYAAEDADITLQLKQVFLPKLKEKEVERVFYEVENPLVKVLTDMEFEGVRIDQGFLQDYSVQLDKEAKTAEASVYKQAGVKFNLASPKQLGEVFV